MDCLLLIADCRLISGLPCSLAARSSDPPGHLL